MLSRWVDMHWDPVFPTALVAPGYTVVYPLCCYDNPLLLYNP